MKENNTQEEAVNLADKKALNFFERIYYSIFKLDKYSEFLEEKKRVSVKYLLLLLFIVALVIIILGIFNTSKMINKLAEYVRSDEFPQFTYNKGILKADNSKVFKDEDLDLYLAFDTSDLDDKQLAEYEGNAKNSNYGFLLYKDKLSITISGANLEYKYEDLTNGTIDEFNKQDVIEIANDSNITKAIAVIFLTGLITTYINIVLVTFINVLMVFLIGYIVTLIIKVPIKYSSIFNIAVYSFTLSIVLNLIYSIVYYLTGFSITNFDTIYMIIAYIYIIAALLILKQNMINTDRIVHVERKVTIEDLRKQEEKEEEESEKELDRLENEKKEQKKKRQTKRKLNPKESLEDKEPDGSEI